MNASAQKGSALDLFDWTDPLLHILFPQPIEPWELIAQLQPKMELWTLPPQNLLELQQRYPSVWFDPLGRYWIDDSTTIEPGAYLSGFICAAPNASIGHCARLRGPVYLGPQARIGHGAEVKNSLLLEGSSAAHLNFVGDSVLGERSNLGAGAVCANLRFDHRPVTIQLQEGRLLTARRKCGAFVGADAQIGCSATLGPGTLVGRRSWICPNISVRGWIPADSKIVHQQGASNGAI